MTLVFNKEENGRWFVVLPDWKGSKEDLEMVAGADVFLDILAQGETSVTLELSTEPFEGADELVLDKWDEEHPENGAYYFLHSYKNVIFDLDMWLCYVTLFVFDYEYPTIIYFK